MFGGAVYVLSWPMTVFHMERPGEPVKLKYLEPGPGSALTERKLLNMLSAGPSNDNEPVTGTARSVWLRLDLPTERMTVMLLGPPEMKPPEIVFSLALAR